MGFFKDIKLNNQVSNRLMVLDDNKKIISTNISYTDIETALSKTNQNELDIANLTTNLSGDVEYLTNLINTEVTNLNSLISNNYIDLNTKITDLNTNLYQELNLVNTNISNLNNLVNNNYTNLNNKITNLNSNISNSLNSINLNISNLDNRVTNIDNNKVSKTNSANKVYGTDENGNQTTYNKVDFGKVDTINNVQADANKNVQIDASNINVDDTDLNPITIQTKLGNLDTTDTSINTKAEAAVKTVTFDNTTYTITFKDYNNNVIKSIDLPLESTVKSGRYDSINKKLILVLQSDDEVEIPVSDLVDVYTGVDGTKIKVTVDNDNKIKAEIKTGTLEKTDFITAFQNLLDIAIIDPSNGYFNMQIDGDTSNNSIYIHASIPHITNSASTENWNLLSQRMTLADGLYYNKDLNNKYLRVNAEDVPFDKKTTSIVSTKISGAIRELKGEIDTNTSDIADLVVAVAEAGKVDKVNNVQPDANKNVQLDASNINVDDSAQTITTVKACLTNI